VPPRRVHILPLGEREIVTALHDDDEECDTVRVDRKRKKGGGPDPGLDAGRLCSRMSALVGERGNGGESR